LNRYAYVRNDPLDLIDATGFGDGPAAAKLVNQTKSGQDVQMVIETAKGIQKIAVTTKSVIQKGASATLDEEIRKRGEKALDKVKPAGDMKEIEPIYDENKKTADTIQKGTLPFKDAWKKAIDATRVTPCDPETKGPPPKTDAPSKHFWDSWFDSAPDPSQPQALDPKAAKQVESSNNQQNAY
jgi:hypothetical protein